MAYKLRFHELAWAEWQKLDGSIQTPLKKKLLERLEQPRVPSAALSGMADCYKIKLRQAGYRLIYRVDDDVVTVSVIAVGKRDKLAAYMQAATYAKSAEIRSRIEPDLKQKSSEVLAELGLDLSGAIRLFLRQVVEVGGLPFEVKKPTPETVAAMMEARAMTEARYGSAKELFDGLDQQASKAKTRSPAKKG